MTGSDMLAEVSSTFPARGIVIDATAQPVWIGIRQASCPYCGKEFSYWPGNHVFRRYVKGKVLYFCRYSCMKSWETDNPTKIEKMIREKRARLEYLMAQEALPPEERTVKGNLARLIERADIEYNRAITRKIWEAV